MSVAYDFSDLATLDGPSAEKPAPPASTTTPSGMDGEVYRSTLDHLVNTGATRDQINAFIKSAGFSESQIRNLDGALAYRDDPNIKGPKARIQVNPITNSVPVVQHDTTPASQTGGAPDQYDFSDLADPEHTTGDELALGGRAIARGLGSVLDFGFLPAEGLLAMDDPRAIGMYANKADEIADDLGLARPQTDGENLASKVIEGATGAAATGGIGAGLGRVLPGVAGRAAASLAEAPIAQTIAGGAAGGASELARQHGAGALGQLGAGLLGGGLAAGGIAGAGKLADSFATTVGNAERTPTPLMQAFDRQQVPALAADVGGFGARMATGFSKTTLGGIPIHEAAQNSINAARAARDRIAADIGQVASDGTAAGNAAQSGARSFLQSTQKTAEGLYNAIPISPVRSAALTNTRAGLQEMTRGLLSNPELSKIWASYPRLRSTLEAITPVEVSDAGKRELVIANQELADAQAQHQIVLNSVSSPADVAASRQAVENAQDAVRSAQIKADTPPQGGELSWSDLNRLRSTVGEIVGQPSLASDGAEKTALRGFYGALSEDMRATAEAEGPKALAAFNRANNYWRAREARIENVVTPILGKDLNKTPEAAFRQIESWAADKGSFVRTAQALRTMPQEEADSVRATIFSKLGNVSAGRNNAAGDVFSPSDFLTQWNKLPERTKNVLFPGKEYQKDIGDILAIAEAQKGATQFANTSNTATASHVGNTLSAGGAAAGFMFAHGAPGAFGGWAATQALQMGAGKLLASPQFARWLASAPKKPNAAAQLAHVNRLVKIATANPVIANDILSLQERLAQSFTAQPVAAQDQGGGQ